MPLLSRAITRDWVDVETGGSRDVGIGTKVTADINEILGERACWQNILIEFVVPISRI